MIGEDIKIRQFLLGSAAEPDTEEIGQRILAGDDFDERLSFAEETLIEDYLDDRLTAEEKRLFSENFLTSPARLELFEELSGLRNYARNNFAAVPEPVAAEKKPDGFWTRLLTLNNLRPVAAVVLLLVVGVALWRVLLYDKGLNETEKTYAVLNGKDLSSSAVTGDIQSKSLIPGIFRGAGDAAKLNAADLTGDVLFRLALPPQTPLDTRFDLELARNGQTVFRQTKLRVYQNQSGQELKVILPKSVLSKGVYRIKLNSAATYDFAVE